MPDSDHKFWADSYKTDHGPALFEPEPLLVEIAAGLDAADALDFGCGLGVNSVWLAENGWQVTGVDWVEEAIEQARRLARDHAVSVDFQVADISNWSPPEKFGLVFNTFALPSKGPARTRTLKTAAGSVAESGTLLILEWDASMAATGQFEDRDLITLDELVEAAGTLEIERADVVPVEMAAHLAREGADPNHEHHGNGSEDHEWRAAVLLARRRQD